jgi:SNF2 family DNA or RNA helicase
MTSRHMTERYAKTHHAVGIWGEISPKQKEVALQKFINDPKCRVFVLQQNCAGIDGLQQVCSDCIFIEVPSVSSMLEQAYSRLYRDGQKLSVNARIAVANGTLQIRTLKSVSLKQDLVNSIQNGLSNLKAAVFGN